MKLFVNILNILVFSLGSLAAQTFVNHQQPDTLNILAVMVDFQADNYDATIGTGKFGSHYTQAYGDTILDPLPHDASYFSDHLEFAKNYFYKVSGGKLVLNYHVIPQTVTVSKYMREYWPPYDSDDYSPLTELAKESWQSADANNPDINFSDYDLFILFHAGVSNSLDDGSLTLDRNLPSLYLSFETMKNIYGNDFTGFPVENGRFNISNTIILPETESREYDLITGDILLQELTINGVIVTNIASHLGLPDLFDTSTGRSKIGRFGLMDSQASIANWGLFPPMPSAWEKIFLGWDEAVEFVGDHARITLTASKVAIAGDTTILKIPINSNEYYLLENRIKDAGNDHIVLKYKVNSQLLEKTVYPDQDGYYYIENDEIDGVLIDVDDYDASLPGDGIVIWHIDENVIREKGPVNQINNDSMRPGIDVEEADGIQDLGEVFQTIFGDVIVGEGSIEDFWYASNPAELYQNKFSPETNPSTLSNYGSTSNLVIENFSDISNRMTFLIRYENNEVKQVLKKKISNQIHPKFFVTSENPSISNFYIVDEVGTLHVLDAEGDAIYSVLPFSMNKPAVVSRDNGEVVIGCYENRLVFLSLLDGNLMVSEHEFRTKITTPVVESNGKIIVGLESGVIFSEDLNVLLATTSSDDDIVSITAPVTNIAVDGDYTVWTSGNMFHSSSGEAVQLPQNAANLLLTKDKNGDYQAFISAERHTGGDPVSMNVDIYTIKNGIMTFEGRSGIHPSQKNISMADLTVDGENSILYPFGNALHAINPLGVMTDNYPVIDDFEGYYTNEPLVLSGGENESDRIITFTNDGRINILDGKTGNTLLQNSFTSGDEPAVHPILFKHTTNSDLTSGERLYLAVLNKSNDLFVWDIGAYTTVKWGGLFGNNSNTSFVPGANTAGTGSDDGLLVDAYNWPNPVYNGYTHLRYRVRENSNVNIKILDLSGDLIREYDSSCSADMDTETNLDLTNYESGVYFAVLEFTSVSGRSGSKIVKIAVIK